MNEDRWVFTAKIENEKLAEWTAGGVQTWHNILRAGNYVRGIVKRRKLTITKDDLLAMVEQFQADVADLGDDGGEVPVDYNHAFGEGSTEKESNAAAAWINELRVEGENLQAHFDWNEVGFNDVRGRLYKRFSSEFGFAGNWQDEHGTIGKRPRLFAVTLTNRPFLRSLGDARLTAYNEACNTTDEQADTATMGDEQMEEKLKALEGQIAQLLAQVAQGAEMLKGKQVEFDAMKQQIEQLNAQRVAVQATEAQQAANALCEAGKIARAEIELFAEMYRDNRAMFDKFAAVAPVKIPLDQRMGVTGQPQPSDPTMDPCEQFAEEVAKVARDRNCTSVEAENVVRTTKPAMFTAYIQSYQKRN